LGEVPPWAIVGPPPMARRGERNLRDESSERIEANQTETG